LKILIWRLLAVEISKGPNNTSFGSGLGGVIHLFARETTEKNFAKSLTTYGSYGLVKQSLGAGYSDANRICFRIIRTTK
jgi:iron complex outermembrane receptor protein